MKPKLSILLPAMLGYETVLAALDAWEIQSCRDQIEILVLCPNNLGPTEAQRAAFPPSHILVPIELADLHEARAIGIQRASADYVMLAEDHCLPDPDWTRAILARMEEGWDAIGSVLRPGNRGSCWTEGSFLIGYGEWMIPITGGPTKVLCGWNGTIRTHLIRQFGPEIADEMVIGAFMIQRLRSEGHRFYLEECAKMRHFDRPGCIPEIQMFATVGMGFGAMRTRPWPILARLLYPLLIPGVALLHWRRAVVQYRRAGSSCGVRRTALVAAAVLAFVWAVGEGAGALIGINRIARHIWRTEVKPVQREEVARSTIQEQFGA